jgi:parallel beta-helix repeat protein
VDNNRRAGIRFERVGDVSAAGEALIENNEVHGNSADENRGGISVRDAQYATIRYNRFGDPPNSREVAIIASDSGRSSRPDLRNILIENSMLNGEIIKGCELPDTIVRCPGYTP